MRTISRVSVLLFFTALAVLGQDPTGSLTGKVTDFTGTAIPKVRIRLTSEAANRDRIDGLANDNGEFAFTDVLAGTYTVECFMPGFANFTAKGIQIADRATVKLPLLKLQVGACPGPQLVNYFRLLPSKDRGAISGKIQLDEGPLKGVTPPIEGATVKLLCSTGGFCAETSTNQSGEFSFSGLYPGNVSLQMSAKGYYTFEEVGLLVEAAWERSYYPFYLQRCRDSRCDPAKLPKKQILCE